MVAMPFKKPAAGKRSDFPYALTPTGRETASVCADTDHRLKVQVTQPSPRTCQGRDIGRQDVSSQEVGQDVINALQSIVHRGEFGELSQLPSDRVDLVQDQGGRRGRQDSAIGPHSQTV